MHISVLSVVNEQFMTEKSQVEFKKGVAITNALLGAEAIISKRIQHPAMLGFEKSYDKLDRHSLLKLK